MSEAVKPIVRKLEREPISNDDLEIRAYWLSIEILKRAKNEKAKITVKELQA